MKFKYVLKMFPDVSIGMNPLSAKLSSRNVPEMLLLTIKTLFFLIVVHNRRHEAAADKQAQQPAP